jgi:hypothetical protein
VEQFFDAPVERWTNGLSFGNAAPLAGRSDGAGVRAEPNETRQSAISLTDELTERELSVCPRLSRPRVPDVRVMGPHDYSRRWDIMIAV